MPEYDVIDVGDFADDPDADDLRTGGIKTNSNAERLFVNNVGFSTTLDFSGRRYMGILNSSGVQQFSLGTQFIRGGVVAFEAKGDMDLRFPEEVKMVGRYDKEQTNWIYIENQGGITAGAADLCGRIESRPDSPSQGLVIRQRLTTSRLSLFSSITDALSASAGSGSPSTENKYSIADQLEDYRWWDGFFYFRLRYFNLSQQQVGSDIVWRQRSNPGDLRNVDRVDDFLPISGTTQLNFTRAGGGTATPGGLCFSVRNPKAVWTMFPGETDQNVETSGTVGTTRYSPSEAVTNNLYIPGINETDRVVELRCEGPQ